jgi:hypothetical protein
MDPQLRRTGSLQSGAVKSKGSLALFIRPSLRASRHARGAARKLDDAPAGIAAPMGRCTTHPFAQFTDVVATTARQDLGNSTMDVG